MITESPKKNGPMCSRKMYRYNIFMAGKSYLFSLGLEYKFALSPAQGFLSLTLIDRMSYIINS